MPGGISGRCSHQLSFIKINHANWVIDPREGDTAHPLLREITGLSRPQNPELWAKAMPYVLTACHDPGHALIGLLHGSQNRHRLYLGGRRLIGRAAQSTEDYLHAQEGALKAYYSGLEMGDLVSLDFHGLPQISAFIKSAPSMAVVTGIPSGRGEYYSYLKEIEAQGQTIPEPKLFLESMVFEDIAATWEAWTKWNRQLLENSLIGRYAKSRDMFSLAYCIISQAAYKWIGEMLAARNQTVSTEARLLPQNRLQREKIVHALGGMLSIWIKKTEIDEESRAVFNKTYEQLSSLVFSKPPYELPGCSQFRILVGCCLL